MAPYNTVWLRTRSIPRCASAGALGAMVVVGVMVAPAPAGAQNPNAPCTDGIFMGDVTAYYQQVLADHATSPGNSLFGRLHNEKQAMVEECATRNPGRDVERYQLRQVIQNANGDVIGRIYDYLDPFEQQICEGSTCRMGRYYYQAVVLSGCYTDNVFGDTAYAQSVGWGGGSQGTGFIRLRQSDKVVANTSCSGTPGFNMQPIVVDLTGTPGQPDGNGAIIDDADSTAFDEQIRTNETSGAIPFGFQAATSSVWNMLLSPWDVEDNNGDLNEERAGGEDNWTTPWTSEGTVDGTPATPLCEGGTGDTCGLGYATTWFDSENMWEWQVVYEMRWDASTCAAMDPSQWQFDYGDQTHASPNKQNFELCGDPAALGRLTIIKDTQPDPGSPWAEFRFDVIGPSPASVLLQDPGSSECSDPNPWAACGMNPPWDREDRVSYTDMIASDNPILPGGPYRITESGTDGADLADYTTSWECRNVDPVACSPEVAASVDDPFTLSACDPVPPPASCDPFGLAGTGEMSGVGAATDAFTICLGDHVVCKFTNLGDDICLASANAIGDLQVVGGVQPEPAAFATGAVPLQSGDSEDSIFLASFVPLPDASRWPGTVDHFVLPLPVVENADGDLVPDVSRTCQGSDPTGCLAWRSGEQILTQAPTQAEVANDRRIGGAENERRVLYTQAATSAAVPRSTRAFDWSDSDDLADEHDLWDGFGITYVAGDVASESSARSEARTLINDALRIRQATITDPSAPGGQRTVSFVAGDTFHPDLVVVAGPQNFFHLANDLEGNGEDCDDTVNPNRGYRCFFEQHRRRRRVVLAGSNDGQIHAFDAGHFEASVVNQRLDGEFTFGTGKEVFAHVPRPMLGHIRDLASLEHDFGVDGSMVVDDFFLDPLHDGTPVAADREWRTVAIATYREGNRGLVALDVTQPDPLETLDVLDFLGNPTVEIVPDVDADNVAGCDAIDGTAPSGCGTLPYPAVLWEFEDLCSVTDSSSGMTFEAPCDQDGNGKPDLGFSWSQVNTGRILVNLEGQSDPAAKFVAIFGGGLDAEDRTGVGNFLYMVDVETGKTIYKRALTAGTPSEPAAVDTSGDGFLDTIYIGTVDGLMHKVDLSQPALVSAATGRIDDLTQWAPFAIFDTGGRPLFFPPTVTFVADRGAFALAFGTGDREDLFAATTTGQENRFYMILDPGLAPGVGSLASGPLTEAAFQRIAVGGQGVAGNLLAAPAQGLESGWVLELGIDERVVTKALALSGLLVFTTFDPETPLICDFAGVGQVYALNATNANSIAGIDQPRAIAVEGFAGRPVVMPSGMTQASQGGGAADPFEAARIQGIRESLMDLFPADCRFGSFSLNIGVTLSNTSQLPIASVPVCVVRRNWTEHF